MFKYFVLIRFKLNFIQKKSMTAVQDVLYETDLLPLVTTGVGETYTFIDEGGRAFSCCCRQRKLHEASH